MEALIARAAQFPNRMFAGEQAYMGTPAARRKTLAVLFDNADRLFKTSYAHMFLSNVTSNSYCFYWGNPVPAQWMVAALADALQSAIVSGDVEIAKGWTMSELEQKIVINYVYMMVKSSPEREVISKDIPVKKRTPIRRRIP